MTKLFSFLRIPPSNRYFKLLFLIFLILLSSFSAVTLDEHENWKKVKEKDSFTIYTRDVQVSEKRKIKEVKALAHFDASLSEVSAIFLDVENHVSWFKQCKSIKVLKENTPGRKVYHTLIDIPYPVKDRDIVQEISIQQDKSSKQVTIFLKALPEFIPEKEDHVRMPLADGIWTLKSRLDGTVDGSLTYMSDAGNNAPAVIFNLFVTEGVVKTITNVSQEIEKGSYRKGLSWISN